MDGWIGVVSVTTIISTSTAVAGVATAATAATAAAAAASELRQWDGPGVLARRNQCAETARFEVSNDAPVINGIKSLSAAFIHGC